MRLIASLITLVVLTGLNAQSRVKDQLALKELVDTFSILADTKDVDAQLHLFTEDAIVESYRNNTLSSKLSGRKEIGEAFKNFLGLFKTVYHQNGQQTVDIEGDQAKGISYCTVTLIGSQEGQQTFTTFGVRYNDNYVRKGGKWLIARRISNFMWQDVKTINE